MNYFLTTVRHEPVFCMLSEYLSAWHMLYLYSPFLVL